MRGTVGGKGMLERKNIDFLSSVGRLRACLLVLFKQQFSLFKQHNTYFHNTFSPTCISTIFKKHYQTGP